MKQYRFSKPNTKAIKKAKDHFAQLMRKRREAYNMSQATLAKLAGVDRKTINRIENGHFNPNLDTMIRIASVLKLKPAQMIIIQNV